MVAYRRLILVLVALLLCTGSVSALDWLTAPPGAKILKDVHYARAGDKPLLMDIVLPKEPAGKRPVVVWIHGGGWRQGSKEANIAAWMAGFGYVVASINYRLTDVAIYPAQIQDCKAAIRFLRAHANDYGIDGGRIGVWGASAGGHLAALLGTSGGVKELEGGEGNQAYSSLVQAVCDFFGPTDLTAAAKLPTSPSMITELLGGPVKEKLDLARLASPVTFITPNDSPTLIVHGDKDTVVPISQSVLFYNALRKAGVEAKFVKVKNAGHGFKDGSDMQPSLLEIGKTVLRFFDTHLKPK